MREDNRPDPDALAAALTTEGRASLRIFLGAAPGVGKTWEMLAAGRQRAREGVDVLIGVVETHGRAETEAQIGDLPILPPKLMPYRDQALAEFDLEGAIARRPALILIDELAHTNAPGSRHAKRWEDVAELLEAGIPVWATLNVQHLESLNDDVARITGVRVTETLPDQVLELAGEIELIDITPAELRKRLTEGRIYRPETARRALNAFFREGNLTALREIALRRVAQHVDADVRGYMRLNAIKGPWPASERILALIGADASAEAVVRRAKQLADALHAPWIALHVERPKDGLSGLLKSQGPKALAATLGAEVETQAGRDVVSIALEIAARRNVTQIVIGAARPRRFRHLARRFWARATLAEQLLRQGSDVNLLVVPSTAERSPRRFWPRLPRAPLPWIAGIGVIALVVGIGELSQPWLNHEALGMVFLAAVMAVAAFYGLAIGLFAAALGFLSWNFFFLPPLYQLTINDPRDVVALVVFGIVASSTGLLAGRVRAEALAAQGRIEGLRRIGLFSRRLGEPATEDELMVEIAQQAAALAPEAAVLTDTPAGLTVRALRPEGSPALDESSLAAARWTLARQEEAGSGTATLPSAPWRFLPIRTSRGTVGVLGFRPPAAGLLSTPSLQAVLALADQAAVALERVRLAAEAARGEALSETQALRTALLNSLSHDLRTPLTGIRGSAETLRASWERLSEPTRQDLLASIEEDVGRMTRFLSNIMDLTRLEGGDITPRLTGLDLAPLIDAVCSRVPGALHMAVSVSEGLACRADRSLLEQALTNILENAVKYSPEGAGIRLLALEEKGRVIITLADEGIGIPPEDLAQVFDSFYRAKHGDRVAPGTGLGLAIARGFVQAMGGTISALSPRPDLPRDGLPGTVITISLPLAEEIDR
ncbi:sensor histidine kinase KdpD [Acidisoma cellulosilytica]|uniref:histidine kinase n=1 Tax=Acidisoma cellulosilyticum TaxID=2802395 RepID=A0A964E3X5_9PROT|nr:sensor histidine kinase KdpD [Acidisoma cellulosilyticum]MCB8880889.1 sensor histidine kinase KdpD [Acidisoma cellulosilyticum]